MYEFIDIGSQAFGENTGSFGELDVSGLHFECNENLFTREYDFLVPDAEEFSVNNIRRTQGQITEFGIDASGNVLADEVDFQYDGNGQISYYYNDLVLEETPNQVSSDVILIPSVGGNCLLNTILLTVDDMKSNYVVYTDSFIIAQTAYENAERYNDTTEMEAQSNLMSYYKQLYQTTASLVVDSILADTLTYDFDSLIVWVKNMDSYVSDIVAAGYYSHEGMHTEANSLLSGISTNRTLTSAQTADLARVQNIFNMLSAKHPDSLSSSDINTLSIYAQEYKQVSGGMAQSLLLSYDSLYIPLYHLDGTGITIRSDDESNISEMNQKMHVFPNPSDGNFTIHNYNHWVGNKGNPQLEIYNLSGQFIQSINLKNPNFTIDNNGVYIVRLYLDGQLQFTEKVMVQN